MRQRLIDQAAEVKKLYEEYAELEEFNPHRSTTSVVVFDDEAQVDVFEAKTIRGLLYWGRKTRMDQIATALDAKLSTLWKQD